MSLQDKASIVLPKGFAGKAGTLECWNPNSDALVGLSVVRATTAWQINEAGSWESVAANVPRRDFLNGGCGELLVEPQRTNLFLNSATGATQSITVANATTYSVSFSGTGSITFSGGASGTLNGTGANATDRVSTTFTTSTTSVTCTISGTVEYVNFELGSYATSWVETSGAAATRNADVISDTGLAALLGQSGGGIYFEAKPFILSGVQSFTLSDGTNDNRFQTYFTATQIGLDVVQGGVIQASISGGTPSASAFNKVCSRYTNDDFTIHLGGARVAQDTSGSTFSGTTLSNFTTASATGASSQFYGRIRELVIFNETPTEAQANSLTA